MFLEKESAEFHRRFQIATAGIKKSISDTAKDVSRLQRGIEDRIEDISDQLGWADSMFDDTGDKVDELNALTREVLRRLVDNATRLRHIAAGTKSSDPIKDRAKLSARDILKKSLLENLDEIKKTGTGDKISYQISGEPAEELSRDELQEIFSAVLKEILPFSKTEPTDDEGK